MLQTTTTATLDDLVTKVIITGNEDKDKKPPVVATVKGDVKKYGTLQDIITKDKDTKLSEAKKEAKELLKEKGKPKKTYSIQGIDNPWIKKGDTVYIEAGNLNGYYNVLSIERDALEKTMDLEVEKK